MHICFLCDEYPPGPHGGIGSLTQTMGRAMVARGHRVTVVGIYRVPHRKEDADQGVRVIRLPHSPLPWTGFIVNGARLRAALRRINDDTPIDMIEGPELGFAMLPRSFPSAKVIRLHGGHHFFAVTLGKKPRPWRSWLERRSFSRADHLCAVSHFVADVTRPLLHLGTTPIEVLPNPVDTSHFQPSPETPADGLIVFMGTLCEKKGVRQLVQALPAVLGTVPNARLMLLGRDSHDPVSGGSYAEMLRTLLPHEQTQRIEFAGHVGRGELPAVLARASVAVFPSHMESQGLVIVEAMASGKAVVTTGTGPGPEIVEDGVSGLLCDPHVPASIAQQIIAVLTNSDLRTRLGAAARIRAVNVFSEEALVARTEAFYARCVESAPPVLVDSKARA